MSQKRFLLDFEVESHGCLADGADPVQTITSGNGTEISISNLSVTPGTDRPLLSMQLVYPEENIQAAKEVGTRYMKEYLQYLSFASNLPFRIHRLLRIVEWTLGLTQRDCHQFERFPGSELPYPVLERPIFESIEKLLGVTTTPAHKRALKWFSAGVSAEYTDDQFQYFWLVAELVAQLTKTPDKVSDQCSKCRGPLFCQACNDFSMHRPYPKQAIRQLLEQTMQTGGAEFFELTSEIRNAIMHGDEVSSIEKKRGIELASVVNTLGGVAWTALLNAFIRTPEDRQRLETLAVLQTNMYARQVLTVTAHLLVYSSNPNEPKLSEFARPTLSLVHPDAQKTI